MKACATVLVDESVCYGLCLSFVFYLFFLFIFFNSFLWGIIFIINLIIIFSYFFAPYEIMVGFFDKF